MGEHFDHRLAFFLPLNTVCAPHLIDRDTKRHGGLIADRFLGVFQHLTNEARAVLNAAAIFICAMVAMRR